MNTRFEFAQLEPRRLFSGEPIAAPSELVAEPVAAQVATATTSPGTTSTTAMNQASLRWQDNSVDEMGFCVERSFDGVYFREVARVASGVSSFQDTGLTPGATFHYQVRAYGGTGFSDYSNMARVTLPQQPLPEAPTDLKVTLTKGKKNAVGASLSWTDNASNESLYFLELSTDGVNFTRVGILSQNTTAHTYWDLHRGTTYYFRVQATNSAGQSAFSNVVTLKV